MWGVAQNQISYIIGAEKRTEKISPGDKTPKLTPKHERNEAIVKLYKEGWKQKALAEMWGVVEAQISYIIGAANRTEEVKENSPGEFSESVSLTPKHEQIIRRAPEELQDKIAQVVLTRETKPKKEGGKPKRKMQRSR